MGNRYELLHGVLLVKPQAGLPHRIVATRLTLLLGTFLADEVGVQICAPGAVQIRPSIHLELISRLWPPFTSSCYFSAPRTTRAVVSYRSFLRDGAPSLRSTLPTAS